jgi:hypothetical protein
VQLELEARAAHGPEVLKVLREQQSWEVLSMQEV